jgi:hypothetical protein
MMFVCYTILSTKLKSRYGTRRRFQEQSLELSSHSYTGWRASTTSLCLLGSCSPHSDILVLDSETLLYSVHCAKDVQI